MEQQIMPIDELLTHINCQIENVEYSLKKARSPKNKRMYKNTLIFWTSIKEYLKPIENDFKKNK